MGILTGNIDQKLTINHQVHSFIQVPASYICVYGTFITAGVLRSHAEEHQTVVLPKHNLRKGAVYVRLLAAVAFHDHPLFSALVKLWQRTEICASLTTAWPKWKDTTNLKQTLYHVTETNLVVSVPGHGKETSSLQFAVFSARVCVA